MLRYLRNYYLNSSLSRKISTLITFFITIMPTTLVAALGVAYYTIGVQALFNEQVSRSIAETVEIAQRYLKEHKDNIKSDVFMLAKDIEKNYDTLVIEPALFTPFLDKQAELRNLSEVIVFQHDRIVGKNTFAFSFAFDRLPVDELEAADSGDVVLIDTGSEDKVRAVIKLNHFVQTYLIVGRYVDQSIMDYAKNTQGSAIKYKDIMADLGRTQFKLAAAFVLMFIVVASISLLFGRKLAIFITRPLNQLVSATEKLKAGDFSYQLPEQEGGDETAILTRAFNQMTKTLSAQRTELIRFNKLVDERRRFTEKILSEISAGVITLDAKGVVLLVNEAAKKILHINRIRKGAKVSDIFSEASELVSTAISKRNEVTRNNFTIIRDNTSYHLFIRVGVLSGSQEDSDTIILTFDDITELLAAQRASAWADVARRVAHEIKNPLTPISLAAERIKSKYAGQIKEGSQHFVKYIDTIVRYVEDIKRIVVEFAEFARIPGPILHRDNLVEIVQRAIFSQKVAAPSITCECVSDFGPECWVNCDATQISQVLLNLLKNAAESIEQRSADAGGEYTGAIKYAIGVRGEYAEVCIIDNGIGMDSAIIGKIFDPYVTSKPKGTGLGLAIVKKIIDDHGGSISIKQIEEGTEVKFTLPLYRGE